MEAELRILNDRGYGFRSAFPAHPFLDNNTKQKEQNTSLTVASRTVSNPPSPARPYVKLPPPEADTSDKTDTAEDDKSGPSPSVASVQPSKAAEEGSVDLPGMRWTEKWKEKNGNSGSLIVETAPPTKPITVTPKRPYPKTPTQRAVGMANTGGTVAAHPYSPRGQMQYKINIPQPSSDQMDTFHHRPTRSVNFQRARKNDSHASSLEISYQKPTSAAFNQGTFSQSASSGSDISTYKRKKIVTSIPHLPAKASSKKVRTLASESSVESKKDVVNIVWKGRVPEALSRSSSHQRLPAPPFVSPSLLDSPPSFPFSESPDLQSFPFLPILPQSPRIPFLEPLESTSAKPVDASKVRHPGAYVTTRGETRNVGLGPLARKHAACYEWNYYLECRAGKDGKCQKSHVCEICASAEHRAAQHWHHLATAPLPEIQVQPQLSTIAPPPESPTLSALKDRFPLFVPPKVPLFVPTPGLEASQKENTQLERLRLRRRQARSKSVGAHAIDTTNPFELGEMSNTFVLEPTPRESRRIPIMIPPSSPSEKPIEVILPPAVRPFQRKPESREETPKPPDSQMTTVSPGGSLRPAAPAFEPSYAGAWVPFTSPTSQFGNLFKIPSRASRKIEIVAPKDKGKEKEVVVEPAGDVFSPNKPLPQMRNDARSVKSNTSWNSKDTRTRKQRGGSGKRELGSPFSMPPKRADAGPIDYSTDFAVERAQWYMDSSDSCEPSTSAPKDTYTLGASRTSFPTDNLDSSVIKILDEQLEAVMGKASEEMIAATLESIIEICSTSSSATTPRSAHFEQTRNTFNFAPLLNDTPIPQSLQGLFPLQPPRSSLLATQPTSNFFSLADFGDDDVFLGPLPPISPPRRNFHPFDQRPRSADSISTAPLTPLGSPQPPATTGTSRLPAVRVDNTPLKGRVERMMSCAAARGAGQCNCGLGDWFHHSRTV